MLTCSSSLMHLMCRSIMSKNLWLRFCNRKLHGSLVGLEITFMRFYIESQSMYNMLTRASTECSAEEFREPVLRLIALQLLPGVLLCNWYAWLFPKSVHKVGSVSVFCAGCYHRFRISDVGETLTKYCGTAILLTVFEIDCPCKLSLPSIVKKGFS